MVVWYSGKGASFSFLRCWWHSLFRANSAVGKRGGQWPGIYQSSTSQLYLKATATSWSATGGQKAVIVKQAQAVLLHQQGQPAGSIVVIHQQPDQQFRPADYSPNGGVTPAGGSSATAPRWFSSIWCNSNHNHRASTLSRFSHSSWDNIKKHLMFQSCKSLCAR